MPETRRAEQSVASGFIERLQEFGESGLTRRRLLLRGVSLGLAVPALSVLLAACGGDDDDDDDEAATEAATDESTDGEETTEETSEETEEASGDATDEATEAASGDETPVSGGTLTILQTGSIPDLDPQSAYDSDASAIFFGVYEMLLRFDGSDTFSYVPMLAESWEGNDDMTEWRFKIPEGAKFHDGTDCDAEAVAKSFQRFHNLGLGPVNVLTRFVASPDDIVAEDASTVLFKLSYGTDIFISALASQYGPLVISPTAVEENATDEDPYAHEWLRENTVGTGPYMITENRVGEHIVMQRFDDFHGGWDGAHFDEVIFRNVPESGTQRQLLETGEADASTGALTPEDVVQIEDAGELQVERYDTTNANWCFFNYVRLPAQVREALAWAFPYTEVQEDVNQGLIKPASGPCTPTTLGYPKDGFIYTTDLEKAQQLLDESGFDTSEELEIWITAGSALERSSSQLYQANLQQIGLNLKITEVEEGALTDLTYGSSPAEERAHMTFWNWWPDYNDAWNEIYPNFHTNSITPNGSNCMYYSNSEVDELLDKSSTMSAGDEYDETIARVNEIMVVEDPAAAFMGAVQWFTIMNPKIRGFVYNPIYINTYPVYDMYRVE